ncbi:MAG TPA: S41 family peptidase [Virgibacillus sp.]|nr:S41 family peptidase [Virgibacillus sp.]
MKKQHIIILLVLALVIGFGAGYAGMKVASSSDTDHVKEQDDSSDNDDSPETDGNEETNEEEPEDMDKVVNAFHLIQDNYLEGADDDQLIEGAIKGMVNSLDDPYSAYMDSDSMGEFNQSIESSFEGIGAEVSMVGGNVTIISPIKDSPAEKEGLRPNDQIKSIDGESTSGLDLYEAVEEIRGEKGSEVVIEIQRPGVSEPFEVTLTRDEIPVETVYSDMKDVGGKKTGTLEITSFAENTANEFEEQLTELEDDGMEGLVIDVRGNPGGLLTAVEDILGLFVPEDMPYLQIEDPDGNQEPFYSNLDEKKEYPISVLTDEGSASASEILAIALKEMGYDTVGETSFGKGTVQNAIEIDDEGDTIKLTYYKWLSPEGEWIHDKGIEPTIEVEQPDYYYTNPVEVDEELKIDQANDDVKNIQVMLEGLGFETGRTDGYFNEDTEKAVKKFQEDHDDLKASGVVDEKTSAAIETEIVEKIRDGKDDQQMEKALDSLY